MKKILLTAFEPFGGEQINPSLEAARAIREIRFDNAQVDAITLPVARFEAENIAIRHLRTAKPGIIVMLGQAGRSARVTPERVAINIDDYPIPDNAGNQPSGESIIAEGPVGYFSTLPIQSIVTELKKGLIPAAISNTAGTYLCNRLFYSVMHCIASENLPINAGFIHIPYLHEQIVNKLADTPSLSRETLIEAVRIAVEVSLRVCISPEDR